MARKILDDDINFDEDFDDELGGLRSYESAPKRKCPCGHRGELLPDPAGWACAECGYVLIET